MMIKWAVGVVFTLTCASVIPRCEGAPTPVYQWSAVETFAAGRWAFHRYPVPLLPTSPGQSWTMNLFLKADEIPTETTIVGGFGDTLDSTGTQRYIIFYHGAVGFWSSNTDCLTDATIERKKWEMVTVTYDGATISVYKNAKLVKSAPIVLKEAEPVVNLGTEGPWGQPSLYRGRIAKFAIWSACLQAPEIDDLYQSQPADNPPAPRRAPKKKTK
ncbi:MAG: LamG-like jellyroll fold domain-containing protein [Capsulimonas sp.]|uniref:LamG-like jellyroll fold domain-containing protein n=1 Tax=Capsulimonas sp. TaxID=2494211 RepID=UPI0032666A90